jgi:hypothetical protein
LSWSIFSPEVKTSLLSAIHFSPEEFLSPSHDSVLSEASLGENTADTFFVHLPNPSALLFLFFRKQKEFFFSVLSKGKREEEKKIFKKKIRINQKLN